jgi:glycosyltransferase involved in cell wall biosynthesis
VSYNAEGVIGRCLDSLRAQKTAEPFEIIVVDSSADGAARLVESEYPEVTLITFPERKFPGAARNAGLATAHGEVVAFIDADCTADVHWVDAILEAHRTPHAAIGGAIANDGRGLVTWAAYFCEFSEWMPGGRARWLSDMAAANISYKRPILDEYRPLIEGTYCSDSELHWRMARDGHRIWFDPSVLICHHSIGRLGAFLRHTFAHGQSFARVRVGGQRFSAGRRAVYAGLCWLIPLVLTARQLRRHARNRACLGAFLKSLPLVIAGLFAWGIGEGVGYVKGARGQ